MAPLKQNGHAASESRSAYFHPFTGMAPLKRQENEYGSPGTSTYFHPFTGMAPLKLTRLSSFQMPAMFPSLHRDGPIEAYVWFLLPGMNRNFHPFTGMAPLKLRSFEYAALYGLFHPFTGMAPLKLAEISYDQISVVDISIPSQGWPH